MDVVTEASPVLHRDRGRHERPRTPRVEPARSPLTQDIRVAEDELRESFVTLMAGAAGRLALDDTIEQMRIYNIRDEVDRNSAQQALDLLTADHKGQRGYGKLRTGLVGDLRELRRMYQQRNLLEMKPDHARTRINRPPNIPLSVVDDSAQGRAKQAAGRQLYDLLQSERLRLAARFSHRGQRLGLVRKASPIPTYV